MTLIRKLTSHNNAILFIHSIDEDHMMSGSVDSVILWNQCSFSNLEETAVNLIDILPQSDN